MEHPLNQSVFYRPEDGLDAEVIEAAYTEGMTYLPAGTPVDEDGALANDENAIGVLVRAAVRRMKIDGSYYVKEVAITKGLLNIDSCEAMSGLTFDDDAITALTTAGIRFVHNDGSPEPAPEEEEDSSPEVGS